MKIEDNFIDDYFKRHHLLLEPFEIFDLSWDDLISNLNMCVLNQSLIKTNENFGLVLHDTHLERLREIPKFALTLSEFFGVKTSTHYFVSFSEKSKTFGRHRDTACVFLYQAIGETEVTVWDQGEHVYRMKKNDIIYIPRGIDHSTRPLTPRVNISFGLDYED